MLEVFFVYMLCKANKRNALRRGRKPGAFIAITIILWVGLELFGLTIGIALEAAGYFYLLGVGFALLGGLISYLIAKNCKPGDYLSPQVAMAREFVSHAEKLSTPAMLLISTSLSGSNYFYLNGQGIGFLRDNKSLAVPTVYRQNILLPENNRGVVGTPLMFNVDSSGLAQIRFISGNFSPNDSNGIMPVSFPADSASRCCSVCGSGVIAEARFCSNCGAEIIA